MLIRLCRSVFCYAPLLLPRAKAPFLTKQLNYIAGLRKVYPYYFNFTTFAKPHWVGRTLLDVYTTEFGTESPDNYVSRMTGFKLIIHIAAHAFLCVVVLFYVTTLVQTFVNHFIQVSTRCIRKVIGHIQETQFLCSK